MSDLARMVDTVFISPVIDINSKMYIAVFGIFLFWFLILPRVSGVQSSLNENAWTLDINS